MLLRLTQRLMWTRKLRRLFESDFAFRQDTTLMYLPIVIAFLTLLSICMTHSSAYIKHVTLRGSESLQQRLHLHVPHGTTDVEMKQLYDEMATIDGIEEIDKISASEMQSFLSSWLSIDSTLSGDFPVPTVLDIVLRPDIERNKVRDQLDYYLQTHINGALLESYDDSIAAFNQSAELIKTGLYLLGLVVLSATTMIVIIISRISLGVHKKHIETLHHLGANDVYVNRQFIKRTAVISLQGVIGGTLLSVLFIEIIKSRFYGAIFPAGSEGLSSMWIYYIVNPVLITILVMMASWVSIEAQLKRMH